VPAFPGICSSKVVAEYSGSYRESKARSKLMEHRSQGEECCQQEVFGESKRLQGLV
jgi:hypothetical protein